MAPGGLPTPAEPLPGQGRLEVDPRTRRRELRSADRRAPTAPLPSDLIETLLPLQPRRARSTAAACRHRTRPPHRRGSPRARRAQALRPWARLPHQPARPRLSRSRLHPSRLGVDRPRRARAERTRARMVRPAGADALCDHHARAARLLRALERRQAAASADAAVQLLHGRPAAGHQRGRAHLRRAHAGDHGQAMRADRTL